MHKSSTLRKRNVITRMTRSDDKKEKENQPARLHWEEEKEKHISNYILSFKGKTKTKKLL